MHIICPISEEPINIFENHNFLTSLESLMQEEGRFQIPRPRYVDPTIFEEYFWEKQMCEEQSTTLETTIS